MFLERLCNQKGLRITERRSAVIKALEQSQDHPDVEALHRRAARIDSRISVATVYRTLKLLEESRIIERHDFGDGRARYEAAPRKHHDHLIDLESGEVIEFSSPEIERLQEAVAERLGYKLIDHRLELYASPLKRGRRSESAE